MKHIGSISVVRSVATRDLDGYPANTAPVSADAKADFLNAIWRAWWDYVDAKKNELSVI